MALCNTLRYRARNSADGTLLRIGALLTIVSLIVVGVLLGTQGQDLFSFGSNSAAANDFYEDYSWDELPTDVKKAAMQLGFNRGIWDHDEHIESFDSDWWDLSEPQRDAAKVMGYDEKSWCDEYEDYEEEMEERREFYPEWEWDELPPDAQGAATVFGFTQYSWDNDIPIVGMDKDWDDLTAAEKNAAKTLGYDEDIWCEEYEEQMEEQMDFWLDEDWEDLPNNVKQAAGVFGFDQQMWDRDTKVPKFDEEWDDLTKAEQDAATTLGYTKDIWCDDFEEYEESEEEIFWADEDWDDLPNNIKDAAKVFGFTQQTWDAENGNEIPEFDKDWDDLTPQQQGAATMLGYTKEIWCQDFDESEFEIKVEYEEENWADLPSNVQAAAKVLGFTQQTWDAGKNLPSFDKDWDDLSKEQQEAAMTIGWDKDEWCEEYENRRKRRGLRGQ